MRRRAGLTLMEVVVSSAILALLAAGMMIFEVGAQRTYSEQQVRANLHQHVRSALRRMVLDTSAALTIPDCELSTLWPASGTDARGLQFREVTGGDGSGPVFGRTVVFAGPHPAGAPAGGAAAGIVRLREANLHHPTFNLTTITGLAGLDGLFGTADDQTSAVASDGQRVVEVLVPASCAPITGPMLRVDLAGRVVTFTIRANFRQGDGNYLLVNDLVMTERAALLR
ncbi:MAG: type II secretion system protein [Planctomycetes bacterium]|nr:type II secretion system protein [Planctomycetota bacterium]